MMVTELDREQTLQETFAEMLVEWGLEKVGEGAAKSVVDIAELLVNVATAKLGVPEERCLRLRGWVKAHAVSNERDKDNVLKPIKVEVSAYNTMENRVALAELVDGGITILARQATIEDAIRSGQSEPAPEAAEEHPDQMTFDRRLEDAGVLEPDFGAGKDSLMEAYCDGRDAYEEHGEQAVNPHNPESRLGRGFAAGFNSALAQIPWWKCPVFPGDVERQGWVAGAKGAYVEDNPYEEDKDEADGYYADWARGYALWYDPEEVTKVHGREVKAVAEAVGEAV